MNFVIVCSETLLPMYCTLIAMHTFELDNFIEFEAHVNTKKWLVFWLTYGLVSFVDTNLKSVVAIFFPNYNWTGLIILALLMT